MSRPNEEAGSFGAPGSRDDPAQMTREECEQALAEVLASGFNPNDAWAAAVVEAATTGPDPLDQPDELNEMRAFADSLEFAGIEAEVAAAAAAGESATGPRGAELLEYALTSSDRAGPRPIDSTPRASQAKPRISKWIPFAAAVLAIVGLWRWLPGRAEPSRPAQSHGGSVLGPEDAGGALALDATRAGGPWVSLTDLPAEFSAQRSRVIVQVQRQSEGEGKANAWDVVHESELPVDGLSLAPFVTAPMGRTLRVRAWIPAIGSGADWAWSTPWLHVP